MKKIGILFSTLLLFLLVPVVVFAQKDVAITGDRVVLSAEEVIDHDYFAAGEIVEIYGTVNGDVYVAGGQLIINGTINGDLLAAGGQMSIDSTVPQNARIAGGQISVDGNIGRNLTIGGRKNETTKRFYIGRAFNSDCDHRVISFIIFAFTI